MGSATDLEIKSYGNLVAIDGPRGPIGFHSNNLQVARLTSEAWKAFSELNEAAEDLKAWSQEINPDLQRERLSQDVRSITLNVTQVCNLHCTYCAAGGDGTYGDPVRKVSIEKTLPQIAFFLNKVPEGGSFQITFIGGEPLLYPEAIKAIGLYAREVASQKGIQVKFTVVTNGTLINEKALDALKTLKASVTVSLDGPPEINDRMRPNKAGKGVTEQVAEGLRQLALNKADLGSLQISAVFGPQNLGVEAAYDYFKAFEADELDFMFDHTCSDPEVSQQFIRNLRSLLERVFQEDGEAGLLRFKQLKHWIEQLDTQTQVENFCGAGKSFLMIDSRNNITTCPWLVNQKTELVGHGTDLWQDHLEPYKEPLIEKNNCQSCWARFLCGGGCMFIHSQATGNKHVKDPQFCERQRSLIASTLMYYEQIRQTEEEVKL